MAILNPAIIVAKLPITLGLYLEGTDNADTLNGTDYADTIHGKGGDDFISGGAGDDQLFGDAGKDTLIGGTGNDTLDGGIGNDILSGGAGADKLIGGDNFDTVTYASASIGVMVDMATGGITNDAQGDTYVGIEKIVGTNYGDILNGDNGDNTLDGGNGDDWLFGEGGNDTLIGGYGTTNVLRGGDGNDTLIAGSGFDQLTGDDAVGYNAGFDHFVLTHDFTNRSVATITDFQSGYDTIDLRDFQTVVSGHVPLQFGSADPGVGYQFGGFDGLVFDPGSHTLNHVFFDASGNQFLPFQIHSSFVIAKFTGGDMHQFTDLRFVDTPSSPAAFDTVAIHSSTLLLT